MALCDAGFCLIIEMSRDGTSEYFSLLDALADTGKGAFFFPGDDVIDLWWIF